MEFIHILQYWREQDRINSSGHWDVAVVVCCVSAIGVWISVISARVVTEFSKIEMSEQIIEGVKHTLRREKGLSFSDDWFQACIEWIKENHSASQINSGFLQEEVFGQWLDANLTDIGCKCLPPRLVDQKCMTLQGRYALQANVTEDIGESAYSQWNKLKKLENENVGVSGDSTEQKALWEPKPRRCMYLTMTDGTQEVYGMEMCYIPHLNVSLKPGVKVMVTGPLECRRGVLHLKPGNIKVLGGEVEALLELNSAENILQKRMNSGNDNRTRLPRPVYKKPAGSNLSLRTTCSQSQRENPTPNASFHSRPTQVIASSFRNANSSSSNSRMNTFNRQNQHADDDPFGDDDDVFMEIDETLLISGSNDCDRTTQQLPQTSNGSSQPQRVPAVVQPSTSRIPVFEVPDDDDDDFIFSQIPVTPAASPPPKKLKFCPKIPFQYIKYIKDNFRRLKVGETFQVKACVATLLSNVSVQDGQWALKINLNDGSGFLEAMVSPELLNRLIGYSAADIKRLKGSNNPADKTRIRNAMSGLSSALVHMNGIFGIQILKPTPIIATYQPIQSSHVQALRDRLATRVLV